MSNSLVIGYPNRAGAGSFSGGSWSASLPAQNMGDRELHKVARSTSAALASTKFSIDLNGSFALRTFAMVNHNLSASASWRVKIGSSAGLSDIYDSGFRAAWVMSFEGLIEWESAVWWSGIAGDEYLRSPYAATLLLPDYVTARYISVEISDTGNSDGYVQVGRFFAGSAIQPSYGAKYGLQDYWRDLSTIEQAEGGALWATARRRLRGVSLVVPYVPNQEAAYFHELQRMVGTVDEVLYIPYPNDPGESQRYGFLGRLSELSAIDYPYFRARSIPLKIEELA